MTKTLKPFKNTHHMPFGIEFLETNKTRFKIWAPDVDNVNLFLPDSKGKTLLEMDKLEDGWFSIETKLAKVGDKYSFELPDGLKVPDPASRYQPFDVHGPSVIIDPDSYDWGEDKKWQGRPWNEAVIYEIHAGTFTEEGSFRAIINKLDYLVSLGITAIELMPVADFPGKRNWGYDGVLLYAPDSSYGKPEDLKDLIRIAHQKGLMVFLDVVYNHFGSDGNYLYCYAKSKFFDNKKTTPWGDAINFSNRVVRDFFIHNALYWLEEYHFDGLRIDAIHAIWDESKPNFVEEIAIKIRKKFDKDRYIHLMLENHNNESRYLKQNKSKLPVLHTAQWNDDFHHSIHVLLTNENDSYYIDYTKEYTKKSTAQHLAITLSEGFAYQNEKSEYMNGRFRGEPSSHLNPYAFINFLQSHDMVGNRAFGERISELTNHNSLKAAICIMLLSPSIPMLFMGEEFICSSPFLFFCDLDEKLAKSVREGRKLEFSKFPQFRNAGIKKTLPDPVSEKTFKDSIIKWDELNNPKNEEFYNYYKSLIAIRQKQIVPLINEIKKSSYEVLNDYAFVVSWKMLNGNQLSLLANLCDNKIGYETRIKGELIAESRDNLANNLKENKELDAWCACWYLNK